MAKKNCQIEHFITRIILFLLIILLPGCSYRILKYHGRNYKFITAGNQVWMAENLATDSYRSGRKIPVIRDYNKWTDTYSPGCGFYNNDSSNLKKYGMLYNWYAVDEGNLCPIGWRVPTNDDWLILEDLLGGNMMAGGKMKSVSGWKGKHISGDDIGFNALASGYRLNEDFLEGWAAIWWSSTPVDYQWVWGRRIDSQTTELLNTLNNRQNGFSVRCIRNAPGK